MLPSYLANLESTKPRSRAYYHIRTLRLWTVATWASSWIGVLGRDGSQPQPVGLSGVENPGKAIPTPISAQRLGKWG